MRMNHFTSVVACLLLFTCPIQAQLPTWIRQNGTSQYDFATDVGQGSHGDFYVCGITTGDLFGPSQGSTDFWVARIDRGGFPVWTRQLGSPSGDLPLDLEVDDNDNLWICGTTSANLFGSLLGNSDVFVAQFDASGNLILGVQFGSNGSDVGYSMDIDSSGVVYLCGSTSGDLASPQLGGGDAWIASLDALGNPVWMRQLGTPTNEYAIQISLDGMGGLYVTGPTDGSFGGPLLGESDVWLGRFDLAGNTTWINQFGTTEEERPVGMTVDSQGSVFLSGSTRGDFAGPSFGSLDTWISAWSHTGTRLWDQQLGTLSDEDSYALTWDGADSIYVAGYTLGSLAATNSGYEDIFVAQLDLAGKCP